MSFKWWRKRYNIALRNIRRELDKLIENGNLMQLEKLAEDLANLNKEVA